MKQLYADVIVDISISRLDRSFQYKVPEGLVPKVTEGSKVKVPFGKGGRLVDGYIVGFGYEPKCDENIIKLIDSCPDNYITAEEKLIQLAVWIRRTYGSTFIQALKTVLPVKEKRKRKPRKSGGDDTNAEFLEELYIKKEIPKLNEEQQRVYDGVRDELYSGRKRPCLIKGVTGSGKTHIYMKLIEDVFSEGKQAILLIPEISLTWQTVSRFYECFGSKAAVLHSRMSKGEKADLMDRIKAGDVKLVIGPRSALFVPFEDLGIIIIDEEQDSSYQSEKTPRYHARETAEKRAGIEDAFLIMGSATPSLEARYRCDAGGYAMFELNSRFAGADMPDVRIVDMRKELRSGRRAILSAELQGMIAERLEKKEQVILFLNKRGHTGYYTCRSCGYVLKCPHCDVALTYHSNGLLMCHYCGYTHPMMETCPKCGSPYIGGFRVGTQQAEEAVKKIFPKASVIRMDRDTTTKKDSHEKILKSFADGEADILIGTQMIVKGHDFPNVTLVGILAADMSLYAGDFRAAERTYQLIVQAVGRAGRGSSAGCGIIQTYDPENHVIQAAALQDYEAFYNEEIENRMVMRYPPAGCFMSVHGEAADEQRLLNAMTHIRKYIENLKTGGAVVLGPAPETAAKLRDKYRMVIYIKASQLDKTVRIRQYTEKYIAINSGFNGINIQFALND